MKNINSIDTLDPSLTQEQCLKNNIETCEAGMEICNTCPEKEQGQRRKWDNDFEKSYQEKKQKTKFMVNAGFIFCCSLLLFLGVILGLFAKNLSGKLILAIMFFCIVSYNSRNKLGGRVVYGGMEKPLIFSLGATLIFLGSLFASQKLEYLPLIFLCFAPGIYLFYLGYIKGPLNGWKDYPY